MSLVKPVLPLIALESLQRNLGGVLCVFKPADLHHLQVIQRIKGNLARDFNAFLGSKVDHRYKLPAPSNRLSKALVTAETQKSFVLGQRYTTEHFRMTAADPPGKFASGVMLLGLDKGNLSVEKFRQSKFLKVYEVKGMLGIATDDHTSRGQVQEKATFRHVRREQLERILATVQAAHLRLQFESSGLDLRSQEAYELACQGLIRAPSGRAQPLIYSLKCTHFQPPDFTLEVQCIGEREQFLTRLVHDLGIDLRCVACCSQLRVTRHGFYALQHALLRASWDAQQLAAHSRLCTQIYRENRKLMTQPRTIRSPAGDSALVRHKPRS